LEVRFVQWDGEIEGGDVTKAKTKKPCVEMTLNQAEERWESFVTWLGEQSLPAEHSDIAAVMGGVFEWINDAACALEDAARAADSLESTASSIESEACDVKDACDIRMKIRVEV